MSREENLLILKMLQDGTITAEQAAELLHALDASSPRPEAAPVPPPQNRTRSPRSHRSYMIVGQNGSI